MWSVTISGHDPANPAIVLNLTVRGSEIRTLSTRCRAATRWRGFVRIEQVSDDYVEIRPSKKSGQTGLARCRRVADQTSALTDKDHIHLELRAYSLRDLIDHCRMRQAELKEKDAQDQTQTA